MRRPVAALAVLVIAVLGAGGPVSASPTRVASFPDGRLDIVTIGDSITYGLNRDGESGCGGSGQSDSYRFYLAKNLVDVAHLPAMYQGGMQHGCHGNTWTQSWGGRTITNVRVDLPQWLNRPPPTHAVPDLAIIIVGVNDARQGSTGRQMLIRYGQLIDVALAQRSALRLVVAQLPHPVGAGSKAVREFNAGLPALVATKGPRVRIVDLSSIGGYIDWIHFNDKANERAAYAIYRALGPWYGDAGGFLPDPPCPYERC
jgi:lysophospholipase L1-like esterase